MEKSTARTIAVIIVLLALVGVGIWAYQRGKKNNEQTATPVLSVSSSTTTAKPTDTVVFTLIAENQTDEVIPGYVMEVNISEVTDKSVLVDAQGASYNSATNSLIWTPLDIPANGNIQKQLSVRVNPLAASATNTTMRIKFNNEATVALTNPVVAGNNVDQPYIAPTTGPSSFVSLWLALSATAMIAGLRKFRLIRA